MLPIVFAAVLAVQEPASAQAPASSPQSSGRTRFDQTLNVPKGTRVELTECMGEVVVKTWNRDAVQVVADGSRRAPDVKAVLKEKVLFISADQINTRTNMPTLDYALTVPAWIDLHIEGQECAIEVTGVTGSVTVKNSDGDIVLRDLGGNIDAESIEGSVEIVGGRGRIKASSNDADITITKATGDIQAESIDGDIKLIDVTATSVDVSSVDGEVVYSGPLAASGKYSFSTHDGDIVLNIPENSSATFSIRRYDGDLHTTLPLKPVGEVRKGRRTSYTLGSGSAQVEIETFDGDVLIRKPGEKIKDKEK